MRDGKTLLIQKSQKNEQFKKLVDSVPSLSIDDIEKLNQPKWVKDALVQIKSQEHYQEIDDAVNSMTISFSEDFEGDVIAWNEQDTFISFGKSEILVNNGDILFRTEKGIWLDSIFTDTPDTQFDQCAKSTHCMFSEYRRLVRDHVAEKYKTNLPKEFPKRKQIEVKCWNGEYPDDLDK